MIRRLFPYFSAGHWGGASLTDPVGRDEDVKGWHLTVQWLGILVEIGAGRVEGPRR